MRRLLVAPCAAPFAALVVAASALAFGAAPVAAASAPNACAVVKTSEISKAFGGAEVSKGTKALKTPVSASCKYEVGATADLPAGTVVISVMFIGGKAAYDGLKKSESFVPTTGLANSIYSESLSVVNTLKGGSLLGAQGLFSDNTLPITNEDVEAQLVTLSKAGLKSL